MFTTSRKRKIMANKKGPLSIVEKFYIVQNPHNKTSKELAAELGRTVKTIENTIKESNVEEPVKDESDRVVDPKGESKTRQLMGRKTGTGRGGVSIMTKEASEYADHTRPQRLDNRPVDRPERYSDPGIAKVFPDED
jgi:hypothetical protein